MKLQTEDDFYRANDKITDIEDAVYDVLKGYNYYGNSSGAVETAKEIAENTAKMLGTVVEMLHKNGALKDTDILKLVKPRYRKVEKNNG